MADAKKSDSLPDWLSRQDRGRYTGEYRGPSPREARRELALADWLGPERTHDVIASLRPPPQQVSSLVEQMMAKFPRQDIYWLERLREAWPQLLGEMNARQSRPLSLQNGTLIIEVSNPTWRFVLERQQKIKIKDILQDFLQQELRSLRFVAPGRFSS
ncbi:MAG: DUF721 domain-containing protein [Oligosphaeraceae bacterium]|nr:DUF721 domain-containing protein [Oligosphaeraceae bacterium]